jgi:hypothetical protein
MKRDLLIFLILICCSVSARQYTLRGFIYQKESNETLVSAYCIDTISKKTSVSNTSGYYSLTLDSGKVFLKVCYLGYHDAFFPFNIKSDTTISFYLEPKSENVGEIIVTANTPIHEQTLLGKETLSIEQLKVIPSFAGETDIMKSIATIPGVSLGREGHSDIYVRGGDRGQNLILLDGAKLYNTSHLGGFFSLLNPNVIKQVDVYKGGFPARYGGRASSVVDIYTRDGNRERIEGKFNLGLLSSGASVEVPLGEKLSFLFAARTSYYDLFTIPARREIKTYGEGNYFSFHFYDINAKLSYYLKSGNKLFVNYFMGNDNYENFDKTRTSSKNNIDSTLYNIKNNSLTIGSTSSLGPKLFFKSAFVMSNYFNELAFLSTNETKSIVDTNGYRAKSKISELNVQGKVEYYASDMHSFKAGIEYSNYNFLPGYSFSFASNSAQGYSQDTSIGYFTNLQANEIDIYAEDEIGINENLFFNVGLRGIAYFCKERNYYKAEPRLSFRAMLNNDISFKANYTLMNQFNHVVVSNFSLFEKEMWIASTKDIPPQQAQQLSFGMFFSFEKQNLELSVEGYYKTMKNLLENRSFLNENFVVSDLETMLIKGGIGESFGTEIGMKFEVENFNANLSYVLSLNNRKFDDLNNGKWYPYIYDRRHDFSCLMNYVIGKHYSISSNFQFFTGTPYTLPEGYVKESNNMYGYYAYSGINNRRLPNYHRLDIAVVKKEKTKKGRIQSFTFNIYNLYAHQNPTMIYYDNETGKVYQKSMFSIIPTISYSLEF